MSRTSAPDPALQAALDAWQAVRDDASIQYAPLPPPPVPSQPAWAKWLENALSDLLSPAGQMLGENWPVIRIVLIGLACLLVLLVLWRLLGPLARWRLKPAAEDDWVPDSAEAQALLDDADKLAAQGRFDEAVHLLLLRSIDHLRAARPEWLAPATTAREIAALPALPRAASMAFAAIAEPVERALFALRPLNEADWLTARAAYADFALARFDFPRPDSNAGGVMAA